jgi:NadR type nicotinamide-nucleotide adenylyltransferase
MTKKTTGLVLGKFMPLHKGHELLIRFAQNYIDELFIIVDNVENAPIDGEIRCSWVAQSFPAAKVFYIPEPTPQAPENHPDFWNVWKDCISSILPKTPDYLFASEEYGFKLSQVIGSHFVPVDFGRENIPISRSEIRLSPMENWEYLSKQARLHYLKRVCIFGPESTGKSTLAKELATHFHTVWVPEYARFLIEAKKEIVPEDMLTIAKGQIALENALAKDANRILFCDTDPLATTIWSKWLFQKCDPEVIQLAQQQQYDLYLLTYPDLEWKEDNVRYFPDIEKEFFDDCKKVLDHQKKNYAIIKGAGSKRIETALKFISQHLHV